MGKSSKFKRRRAAERDQGSDDEEIGDDNDNDGDTHKNNSSNGNPDGDSCNDRGPYTWIGTWIQKPKGERCRRTVNRENGKERIGFTTAKLLKIAGITVRQYSMYKVCFQFPFCRTTDSPQKTALHLIGRYFDTSKKFTTNTETHLDGWALIVEKVRPVHFRSMFLTFPQMKERHGTGLLSTSPSCTSMR